MPLGPEARNRGLRAALGDGPYYLGVLLALPDPDGRGYAEPKAGDYERKIAPLASVTKGSAPLASDVLWDPAEEYWGEALGWGLFTDSTGGELLAYAPNDETYEIKRGVAWRYFAGQVGVALR